MAAPNKKNQLLPRLVQMNSEGMTVADACRELGVHPVTASGWFREAGIEPVRVRTGRRRDRVVHTCERDGCKETFEEVPSRPRRFCSRECTNIWQRENRSSFKECPCGARIELAEGATTMHTYRQYCSDECRKLYGKKRQPNPENYVTFTCQNERCSKEVTRYKKLDYLKYCSNECAQKHTKTRRFYAVEGFDIVFESSYETLFWSLCMLHKVPVERFDRENGIPWRDDGWYAPDFYIPSMELAVEIKGVEDDEDPGKWAAFRERYRLVVLDRESLKILCGRVDGFSPGLGKMAYIQHGDF